MRKIKPIREITPENLQKYHDELYGIGATVLALSKALYHLDEEKNPASVGITLSFALSNVAESLDDLCASLQEKIAEIEV